MPETQLKPCPFCGAPAQWVDASATGQMLGGEKSEWWMAQCTNDGKLPSGNNSCGAWQSGGSKVETAQKWNRRASEVEEGPRVRIVHPHPNKGEDGYAWHN